MGELCSKMWRTVALLALLALISGASIAAGADAPPELSEITFVPGFTGGAFPSRHYGGHVTVDEASGRQLYYYLVESEGDPTTDPLVLWLNGGPGCSSFDGWVYEHGPFNLAPAPVKGGLPSLSINPYSWSKAANMLYLDSPAGVGFSFSRNAADYTTNDTRTAHDTYIFLQRWLQLYPRFGNSSVYLSGESFAGVYVPTLVQHIHSTQELSKEDNNTDVQGGLGGRINLKGYLLGNPSTDDTFDQDGLVQFMYGMGLISQDQYELAETNCNRSYMPPYTPACYDTLVALDNTTWDLNMYNILEPCFHEPDAAVAGAVDRGSLLPASFLELGRTDKELPVRKRMFGRAWPLRAGLPDGRIATWPELAAANHRRIVDCTDDSVASNWLNGAGVRQAIHAGEQDNSVNGTGPWVLCTNIIKYDHDAGSMVPFHRLAREQGYRALVYSGDHDMCVPYTGTESWVRSLGYPTLQSWKPWYLDDQVAGFSVKYEHDFTFATVLGSGHTVPEYKPAQALAMFQRWLKAEPL